MSIHSGRPRARRSRSAVAIVVAVLCAVGSVLASTTAAQAAGVAYVVDGSASGCSDSGPGTSAQPFCTISAATRKNLLPGDSVSVAPAVYREQVTVAASGTSTDPITFRATGPGVLVLGTRDLGSAGWTAASAPAPVTSWQTPYNPPSPPRQVMLAGVRLTQAASASALTARNWYYDATAKVLLVDLGGPSPAGQLLEAGAQSYGFNVVGRHDVAVSGIDVRGSNYAGIHVSGSTGIAVSSLTSDLGGSNGVLVESSSSTVSLSAVTVTNAVSTGIRINASSSVTVRDCDSSGNGLHGIGASAAPLLVVSGSRSHDNAATTGTSTSAGIDLSGATTDAQVVGNTVWNNQDTGIQLGSGANRALIARNISHHNSDHGIHVLGATGATVVGNTSAENRRSGLVLEGSATGARLGDNLITNNGRTTGDVNLLVDSSSLTGLVADYDLAWNSTSRSSVRAGSTSYPTLLAWATASGQEAHGLASDPAFTDPANGDFTLKAGSVAVDSADAGVPGFVGTGLWTPVDDLAVPNRGAGTPPYADRGATEYLAVGPTNHAPHAAVTLNPAQAAVPPSTTVLVDASASSDPDDFPIATYAFDFGDGTHTDAQAAATTSHVFGAPGTYTVTVTVTDTAGATDTSSATELVTARTPVTYWVDRANAACSDAGPGTTSSPLCTIGAATRRALAGDTVRVAAGTYPEQVSFPRGGQAGAPLTIAGSPGTVVTGADASSGAAGARSYGFVLRSISNVDLSGFSVTAAAVNGVLLDRVTASTVTDVDTSGNGAYGISVDHGVGVRLARITASRNASTGVRFYDDTDSDLSSGTSHHNGLHGVSVQASTRVAVRGVTAYANLRPSSRSATGIDVSAGSADTLIEDNRTYGNDDSGIEAYTDAHGTVIRRNLSWDNGDHGIDDYRAPGSVVVSNTVVGNATAGINFEGGSSGATVRDNVSADNAVGSPRTIGNIRVDDSSRPGTTLDRNLVWQSSGGPLFEWQSKPYTTLASFQAVSGQEPNGLWADPRFVDRAGRDLRLTESSPGIDAAQAGVPGWADADAGGTVPTDDPFVTDSGSGTSTYADLGALEAVGPFVGPARPLRALRAPAPPTSPSGSSATSDRK